MKFMVRQEVPVWVKPTGNFNRWAASNSKGEIASIEVEVLAEGYEGKIAWVNVGKLMWTDWEPVELDVIERACRHEADMQTVANFLCDVYPGWLKKGVALAIAECCVQAATERGESPVDLVERIKKAGEGYLGSLASGVSVWGILQELDEKEIQPWDETLAEVQCPPEAVDSFAEAAIDAVMAKAKQP